MPHKPVRYPASQSDTPQASQMSHKPVRRPASHSDHHIGKYSADDEEAAGPDGAWGLGV